MEILKRGSIPSERVYIVTCNHCKSELKFRQEEGDMTRDQRGGDYISVVCPVCGEPVTVALGLGQ